MRRQMLRPLFPAIHGNMAKPALALQLILPVLQQIQIRLPALPFLAPVEFVQMLPQVILARKRPFAHRSLCTGLKLVGLDVLVRRRRLSAKDALGVCLVNAPDEK